MIANGLGRKLLLGLALLAVVILTAQTAGGQEVKTVHRFFGFAGDVTIDGERLQPGDVISVSLDGEAAAMTTVNAAGAWTLDVDRSQLTEQPCNASFTAAGVEAAREWAECPLRVQLALSSGMTSAAMEADAPDVVEGSAEAAGEVEEAVATVAAVTGDGEDAPAVQRVESTELVQPAVPGTGTGGLLAEPGGPKWMTAVALTALLTFVAAAVALLISRRTDSVR